MTGPIVELQSGLIRGCVEEHEDGFNYFSFKSVPYAEPPLGELRFQDPVPVKSWTGVIDCNKEVPEGLQYHTILKTTSFEEDSLYLNVYTRSINEKNVNNPVIMYIFPGTCMFGSADSLNCGPDYLIRKDIVLVVPNYRLGVLGFLNLEDEIASGNQGLKDLVLVLQWIQQNIKNFGGDPENVTVFGEFSSGSLSHFLSLSPLTKGLIHKVISGSACAYTTWAKINNPKSYAIKLCSFLGKPLTDSMEILKLLKAVDAKALLEAQYRLYSAGNPFPFGPGVDSKSPNPFMPVDWIESEDLSVNLPCLVGGSAHEGWVGLMVISREDYFKLCNLDLGEHFKFNAKDVLTRRNLTEQQAKRLYYKSEAISDKTLEKFTDFIHDFLFLDGIHRFVEIQAKHSSAATYLYRFSYEAPESVTRMSLRALAVDKRFKCLHFDEWCLLFKLRSFESKGLPPLKKGTPSYRLMEQLTEMWTNFARYGKPTIDLSELIPVHWKPIADGTHLRYLNIDEDITMQSTVNISEKFSSARGIKI